MAKFQIAVATALAVLASGRAPEECAAGAGRCAAAAASGSDSTSMLQVPIRKHKGRGPQGDNPNVALLGDDSGWSGSPSECTVSHWAGSTVCENYDHHNYNGYAGCGQYCGGGYSGVENDNTYYFSVGKAGDCRCCRANAKYSRGWTVEAWTTYKCKVRPVPCQMAAWSDWTSCSKSCGGGTRSHSRSVTKPKYGGTACGATEASEPCNAAECPTHCVLNDWEDWGACSATCGPGTRSRSRTVATSPAGGGKPCENTKEEGDCPPSLCPVLEVLEVCGKVVDAVDNSPVEGAMVNLQGPQPGTSASQAQTDSGGKFCFTGPQPGTTTLTATLQGWVDYHAPLTITAGMSSFEDVVMSKKIASTKWRIILTWQKEKDLDSYTKFGNCEIRHSQKKCDNGMSGVLDQDSTDNHNPETTKPETTTVQADPSKCGEDCMIYFRVRSHSNTSPLSESQAMVQVIHGDQEAATFEIGKAGNGAGVVENRDWYVLAIDVKSGKVIGCTNAQAKCAV